MSGPLTDKSYRYAISWRGGKMHLVRLDHPWNGVYREASLCGCYFSTKPSRLHYRDEVAWLPVHPYDMVGMCSTCKKIHGNKEAHEASLADVA